MTDIVMHIGKGSIIQHGKLSDRIYLMKLAPEDRDTIADELICLALQRQYSKIFCKVPKSVTPLFLAKEFRIEGYVPGFYKGKEDAFFLSRFLSKERLSAISSATELAHLHRLLSTKEKIAPPVEQQDGYSIRKLEPSDVLSIADIYSTVFESYPFPIYNPDYILETMQSHVQYFGAFKDGCLAAIASSEIDFEALNAELTDFATHKAHTGHHLAYRLLATMEKEMQQLNMTTLYTIARINSIPMNKTFIRMGYEYSGTLINNTQISGSIETMNLYYKPLQADSSATIKRK